MLAALFVVSCDDTTDNIGSSLTDNVDKLNVMTDTFNVTTRSIVADSVLSRSITGYLGMVRDPETGAYTTSNFMTQFYTPENFAFPEKQNIISLMQRATLWQTLATYVSTTQATMATHSLP